MSPSSSYAVALRVMVWPSFTRVPVDGSKEVMSGASFTFRTPISRTKESSPPLPSESMTVTKWEPTASWSGVNSILPVVGSMSTRSESSDHVRVSSSRSMPSIWMISTSSSSTTKGPDGRLVIKGSSFISIILNTTVIESLAPALSMTM